MQRENLVVVRAGDRSLHPQWLASPSRSWDLAVSYYGDFPDRYKDQFDLLHACKGSKWEGLADFMTRHRDLVQGYRYVWFPDDDLFTTCRNIDQFFSLCQSRNFTIAQPALTPYSHHSWPITVQRPRLTCRQTDFVEIMAPCFKVETLPIFEKTFTLSSSLWGVEWLWWDMAVKAGVANFGIVDCTPVFHTREVGSAGSGGTRNPPEEEMRRLLDAYGLKAGQPNVIRAFAAEKAGARWLRAMGRIFGLRR